MTVLLVPGVVTPILFDTTGLPFPNSPDLVDRRLIACRRLAHRYDRSGARRAGVIEAVLPVGRVAGVVDSNVRLILFSVTPFVSFTVAVICWAKFWFTVISVLPVARNRQRNALRRTRREEPAELLAFDTPAEMIVAPGACAVTMPFWSIVTLRSCPGVY